MKTLLSLASRLAPIEVRLLARLGGEWMDSKTIATASGLPASTVRRLGELTSWDDVTIREASLFCAACGVDLVNPRRSLDFINRRAFAHLECTPNTRYRDKLLRILQAWRS